MLSYSKKIIVSFIAIGIIFLSCNKTAKNDVDPNPTESNNDITFITTSAVPGEVVVAQANFSPSLTQHSFITVNSEKVFASPLDSNRIMFILPEVPTGTATINFANIGFNKARSFTVGNYSVITQPKAVLDNYSKNIDSVVAKFKQYSNSSIIKLDTKYIDILLYLKKTLSDNFETISDKEKLQLAYFLRSNMYNYKNLNFEDVNPAFYSREQGTSTDRGEALYSQTKKFPSAVITAILYGGLAFALLKYPEAVVTKLAALAALGGFVAAMGGVFKLESDVGNLKGVGEALEDFITRREIINEVTFINNKTSEVTIPGKFRNIISSDESSNVTVINDFFNARKNIKSFYEEKTVAIYNKITSWFPSNAPSLPAYATSIKANKSSIIYPFPGSKMELKNFSDPGIKIYYTKNDNTLSVKASSTQTFNTDMPFTFDAVYTDTKLGVSISKTINCILKPEKNPWIDTLVGSWKYEQYSVFTKEYYDHYKAQRDSNISANPCGWYQTFLPGNQILWWAPQVTHKFKFTADLKYTVYTEGPVSSQDCSKMTDSSWKGRSWAVSTTGYFNLVGDKYIPLNGQLERVNNNTYRTKTQPCLTPCIETYYILEKE